MNHVNHLLDGVMNGVAAGAGDVFTKTLLLSFAGVFFILVFWWFYRITALIEPFLKDAQELLAGEWLGKSRSFLFYKKEEIKGRYKGREVFVGIVYAGLRGEFMPLPHVRMRLKEAMGYNLNRLPNYAVIEKRFLIYKVKPALLWGVFDKNYPGLFGKNNLSIALEKLLSTAEDVERGRTVKDVFK